MPTIYEYDATTDQNVALEVTEKELTDKLGDLTRKSFEEELAEQATAKAAAQEKLAALGLTTDDLKALGL
jgi:hypothetical protein